MVRDEGSGFSGRWEGLSLAMLAKQLVLKNEARMGRDYPQLCWGSTAWLRRDLMPLIAAWSSN